ncbi:MAG: Stage II sporulation protein E, protein serine/threonine phosphatase [Desulfotomaculum sp. 46_296]|nr:MAG: Stage II sporulation protein E, protein serine/threonine phosphatase [Desulfotomaculum sp. 46_296]KUK84724.1 MAG: Stage II sporulation protein E, protein serine/threonine phosphatase [Desulfofundulus kuznetsovii]
MLNKSEVYPFRRLKKKQGIRKKKPVKHTAGIARIKSLPVKDPAEKIAKDQQEKESKKKNLLIKLGTSISGKQFFFLAAGFFLGRSFLFGELVPFAAAFAGAVTFVMPASSLFAAIGLALGLATAVKGFPLMIDCATVMLIWIFLTYPQDNIKKPLIVIPAIVFALSLILKIGFLAFVDSSPYDYISITFEAVFAGIFTLIFLKALPSLSRISSSQGLEVEELLSVLILLAGVLAGTSGLEFRGVSLQGLLSRFIILILACGGGMGQGAIAGALMGIIPGLAYVAVPILTGVYSFAGFVAGFCRGLGKQGVAAGFLVGNLILLIYIKNFGNLIAIVIESCLAIILFFLFPIRQIEKFSESFSLLISGNIAPVTTGSRLQGLVRNRLNKWSCVFKDLSLGYAQTCVAAPEERREPALQALFREIGQKVCNGCGVYQICWEREFYLTYQSLLDAFAQVELYGQITVSDLPEFLKRRCTRARELAITIACLYETYKLNLYWTKRILESKEIFSEQLKGMSEIVEDLSSELQLEVQEFAGREVYLKDKLKHSGIPVTDVKMSLNDDYGIEVGISRLPCSDCLDCSARLIPVLSQFFKGPLSAPSVNCAGPLGEGLCFLRLYPGLKYQVKVGVAKIGKGGNAVCGDSHAFVHLKGGEFAFMLSDGMGTGESAARESGTALALLKNLLESGLSRELAVKTVNSLMMLRFPGDSFATVDLITLNLYTGQAEFTKIGAPPSFLKQGKRVNSVRANSLPVGIIKDIEVATVSRRLAPGDLVVMVSDGMLDIYSGPQGKENWLRDVIQGTGEIEPQDLADLLLNLAVTSVGGTDRIPDDITILTVYFEKRSFDKKMEGKMYQCGNI